MKESKRKLATVYEVFSEALLVRLFIVCAKLVVLLPIANEMSTGATRMFGLCLKSVWRPQKDMKTLNSIIPVYLHYTIL